jgi:hypothetical protein
MSLFQDKVPKIPDVLKGNFFTDGKYLFATFGKELEHFKWAMSQDLDKTMEW